MISYVTMLLTVRLSYSIDSISLYNWWECLALLAPVIPILTRRKNHSALSGAWLLMGLGILALCTRGHSSATGPRGRVPVLDPYTS